MNSYREIVRGYVKNGAKLLDAKVPDWFNKINIQALQMDDCLQCILGQLFGTYEKGCMIAVEEGRFYDFKKRYQNGFTGTEDTFCVLNDFWIVEIINRKQRNIKEN